MRALLVISLLAVAPLTGCAKADLPAADAGVHGGGDTSDAAAPDTTADATPDDSGPRDAHTDADACVPSTCEELSACGNADDGCGGPLECEPCVDPSDIATVTVAPAGRQVLQVGETLELEATARKADGSEAPCNIEWSSQVPTVARVGTAGSVRGVAPGITDVSADCHDKSDSVRVYVNDSGLGDELTDPDALALWFRADAGISRSGASVKGWEDLSGNGLIVANANFTGQPRLISGTLNDHPVVRFTGNQELRTSMSPVSVGQATVFVVAKNTDATHRGQLLSNCGDGGNNQLRYDGSPTGLYFYAENSGLDTSLTLASPTTDFRVLSVVLSASELEVYVGGQLEASTAVSAGGEWNFGQVGARCSSEHLEGEVAEIMVYDRVLSETSRQQVEQYLQQRYRL